MRSLKSIPTLSGHAMAAAALGFSLMAAASGASAIEAGQPAPAFSLPKQGGGALALSDLKGQVVYLDFWASWCGPCRQSFPWMNEMQARYGGQGFKVVGVNVDAKTADAEKFLSQVPAQFAVAFDAKGETPGKYAVQGMPTSMLIGADGRVVKVHSGFRADDRKDLEAAIEGALKAAGGAK